MTKHPDDMPSPRDVRDAWRRATWRRQHPASAQRTPVQVDTLPDGERETVAAAAEKRKRRAGRGW